MTSLPVWVQAALSLTAALGGLSGAGALALAIINRIQSGGATDASVASRLKGLEDWKQSRSVDRWELEAHTRRLDKLEADLTGVADLKTEVARLVERSEGRDKLMDERFRNLDNRLGGMMELLEAHFGKHVRPATATREAS